MQNVWKARWRQWRGGCFATVDFFDDGLKICFGEMTFYPYNGLNPFKPESFDAYLDSFLKLPEKAVRV